MSKSRLNAGLLRTACLIVVGAFANGWDGEVLAQENVARSVPESVGERLLAFEPIAAESRPVSAALAVRGANALAAPRYPIARPFEGHIEGLDAYWQAAIDPLNLTIRVHVRRPAGSFRPPKGGDEYGGDLVELFLDPSGRGQTKYQFCANPLGLRYDSYQNKKAWDANWTGTGLKEKDGWGVVYIVPLSCFGEELKAGTKSIGINVGVVISGQHVSWTGKWGEAGSFGRLALGESQAPVTSKVTLALLLDRKVYDSLDLTAQGLLDADGPVPVGAQVTWAISSRGQPVWTKRMPITQSDSHATFLLDIRELAPGDYVLRCHLSQKGKALAKAAAPFKMVALARGATKPDRLSGSIPIRVQPNPRAAGDQPLTCGVPMPRGVAMTAEHFRLLGPKGNTEVPLQAKVVARWSPRGYAKWLLLDLPGRVDPESVTEYLLQYGPDVKRSPVSDPIAISKADGLITIDTGPLRFAVKEKGFSFLDSVRLNGVRLIRGGQVTLTDEHGNTYAASQDESSSVTIEESGPIRAVIAAKGWFVREGKKLGQYVVRIYAYRGRPYLRVFHTFVITEPTEKLRYRNIAIACDLTESGQRSFGMTEGEPMLTSSRSAYLVQESHDRGRFVGAEGGKTEHFTGTRRSAGWVDTGRVMVAVRDLWQNFPKELEIDDESLRVHLWPRHPAPVRHPREKVTAKDIHMLWFAHEGELLNFSIPEDYATFLKDDDPNTREFYYIPSTIKNHSDDALGIAKTHEMLWLFHDPDEDVSGRAAAFQEDPGCLPAPEWMAETRALGWIHPVDRTQFPEVETALERHFDYLMRQQQYLHDYGMWNFGDRHSNWHSAEKRVRVNRTWANHHHGSPRTYWLQYMRTGAPKYLAAARRQARHLMDIDTCHYSTPEYEAKGYPVGKIPGALCDYKGLVHWHSGNRLYDYNNLTDYLFYNYYLTGYRRAVDVAQETTDSVARIFRGTNTGRGGEGPLASLSFLYQATWDARLLPRIYAYARTLMDSQTREGHELGAGAFAGWAGYAPWLPRYLSLTRDPAAEACLERWCDWLAAYGFYGSGGAMWHDLTEGYRRFGKHEYLEKGYAEMILRLGDQYLEQGHFYDGHFTNSLTLKGGYFSQRMPGFLAAIASAEKAVTPRYGISWWMPGKIWAWVVQRKHHAAIKLYQKWGGLPVVVMREDRDRAFTVNVRGGLGKSALWVTRAADGIEVARAAQAGKGGKMTVPADGKTGEYVLWVSSESDRPHIQLPVSDLDKEVFAWKLVISRRMHAFFFRPEPDAAEAVISVAFGYDTGSGIVHRPDGSIVAAVRDARIHKANWKELRFPITPDLKGQLMHFTHGRNHDEVNFLPVKGLIPWLAVTPERYFVPSQTKQ
jgi:hypothetical protein